MDCCVEEKTVLNTPGDFCEVKHLVLKGTNFAIGRRLGQIARERHHVERDPASDPFVVGCQQRYMQRQYPIHYERMRGVADAYGTTSGNCRSDFSIFGRVSVAGGCSAVHYPPNATQVNRGILCRNVDFPTASLSQLLGVQGAKDDIPVMAKLYVTEMHPDAGYPSLSIRTFELFGEALDGINSEGLVVAHLAQEHAADSRPPEPCMSTAVGLNELLAVQFLLDTCANVMEAKEALLANKHFYRLAPVHLIVADRHGDSFVWEYSAGHNREYILSGAGQPHIITNFAIHDYPLLDALPSNTMEKACPFNRYRTLKEGIRSAGGKLSLEQIKDINASVFIDDASFDSPPPLPIRTIYRALYDTEERSVELDFYQGDAAQSGSGKSPTRRSECCRFVVH